MERRGAAETQPGEGSSNVTAVRISVPETQMSGQADPR